MLPLFPTVANQSVVQDSGQTLSGGSITLLDDVKAVAALTSEAAERTLPPTSEGPKLRIMVVDDYPDSADTLAELLKCSGHLVQVCYDGATALIIATQFRPQVCLLDLAMPGMDGIELATRLKVNAGSGPLLLIATTALGDWEAKTQTALAGFHYHLTKPVDLRVLVQAITRLGKRLG